MGNRCGRRILSATVISYWQWMQQVQLVSELYGGGGHWCASAWPSRWFASVFCRNIAILELFLVIVSLELWGFQFSNRRILLSTDNKGVCFAVNCLSSKSPQVVSLLRNLVFLCLKWNIWLKAKYFQGKVNIIADALSRLQMDCFFSLLPEVDPIGASCPPHLCDLI